MTSNANIVVGPYQVEATGSVTFISHGEGMAIQSVGDLSTLNIESAGSVSMLAGATGVILLNIYPQLVGPRIQLEEGTITIAVGEIGAGASITLTEAAIILCVGDVTYTLTAEGIVEEVDDVTREVTSEGHVLTAAESELSVGVEGIVTEAPLKEEVYEGSAVVEADTAETVIDGIRMDEAGITEME